MAQVLILFILEAVTRRILFLSLMQVYCRHCLYADDGFVLVFYGDGTSAIHCFPRRGCSALSMVLPFMDQRCHLSSLSKSMSGAREPMDV